MPPEFDAALRIRFYAAYGTFMRISLARRILATASMPTPADAALLAAMSDAYYRFRRVFEEDRCSCPPRLAEHVAELLARVPREDLLRRATVAQRDAASTMTALLDAFDHTVTAWSLDPCDDANRQSACTARLKDIQRYHTVDLQEALPLPNDGA